MIIEETVEKDIQKYLTEKREVEVLSAYFFFLEKVHTLSPVLSLKDKVIYSTKEHALQTLEEKNALWKEVKVLVKKGNFHVNEYTKKIYICPFSGKVFGDNTHPNPQDAIYHWVANCPENKENDHGMKTKRFYVSEDPKMIKKYLDLKVNDEVRVVYSSLASRKLFQDREGIRKEYEKKYLSQISLEESYEQEKYQLEAELSELLKRELVEEKVQEFAYALSQRELIYPLIRHWFEED